MDPNLTESQQVQLIADKFEAQWKAVKLSGEAPLKASVLDSVGESQRAELSALLDEIERRYRPEEASSSPDTPADTVQFIPASTPTAEAPVEALRDYADLSKAKLPDTMETVDFVGDHPPSTLPVTDDSADDPAADEHQETVPETFYLEPKETSQGDDVKPGETFLLPNEEEADETDSERTADFQSEGGPKPRMRGGKIPTIPGYKIQGELGRGGMGVVYRARQIGLNRDVALKMILAAEHAGADQLARFRAEGEAVAQLQHPNIAQIYDIGEASGFPFFSLEFVDGEPLEEKIGGNPQPVNEAAAMVETLARAMSFAHERGIVHRDLKPDNVLLTKEGVPKISDFGLVKRTESDSSHTRTGTIMGTPSYMAPEQARAQRDVGPLADLYSLGAILYKMLTGRPPFLGATIMETLNQLLNQEPLAPSRLQPKVPRDLETICLKCLQKDPNKRYGNAELLAEDLRRFIEDKPIKARPVSVLERVWRWRRRNPRLAISAGVAALLALVLIIGGPTAAIVINHQKGIAEEKEAEATQARGEALANLDLAEKNEAKAIQARLEAETNAEIAKTQGSLAINSLHTLVAEVQTQLKDTPATHQLKRDLLETALKGFQEIALVSQDDAQHADFTMAAAYQRMGQILIFLGRPDEALKEYQQCQRIIEEIHRENPQPVTEKSISISLNMLGDVSRLLGDKPAARDFYQRAITMREAIAKKVKFKEQSRRNLATVFINLAEVSEPSQAEPLFQRALDLRSEIARKATDENRLQRKRDVLLAYNSLASFKLRTDQPAAAAELFTFSLKIARQLHEQETDSFQRRKDLANSYQNVGVAMFRAGETAKARQQFKDALAIYSTLEAEDPEDLDLQTTYVLCLSRSGDHERAAEKIETLLQLAPDNFKTLYNVACCYSLCALSILQNASEQPLDQGEQSLVDRYADQSVAAIQRAVEKGLKDLSSAAEDPDLGAIHNHAKFIELAKDRTH